MIHFRVSNPVLQENNASDLSACDRWGKEPILYRASGSFSPTVSHQIAKNQVCEQFLIPEIPHNFHKIWVHQGCFDRSGSDYHQGQSSPEFVRGISLLEMVFACGNPGQILSYLTFGIHPNRATCYAVPRQLEMASCTLGKRESHQILWGAPSDDVLYTVLNRTSDGCEIQTFLRRIEYRGVLTCKN